jgi:ribulose-5-phosphate 4-epimerase/fuculose-1-phosphate aldolase
MAAGRFIQHLCALAALALFAAASVAAPHPARAAAPATPQEVQALKEKLALATRMLAKEGLIASSGHLSVRIPGTNEVLIGPGDVSRDIVTADDIVTVDLDSKQIAGKRHKPDETEIHTAIYRARPDVNAVVHDHPKYSVMFSIIGKPILPVHMHGAIFADGVPVFTQVGHVNTREVGDAMARVLGKHRAVVLKMHGSAVTGSTLEEAFVAALQLEENCEVQALAESAGKVTPMTPADVARSVRQSFGKSSIDKRWQYYLDKYEPEVAKAKAKAGA